MQFQYSSFISYRHEQERNKFIKEFCRLFNRTTFDVTNKQQHFIDTEEIQGSPNISEEIYEAIRNSYFFSVFHTPHYLNEDNPWCARELKYALDVEECRRKKLKEDDRRNFYSLNLFIVNGRMKDLPREIKERKAYDISPFEYTSLARTKTALGVYFKKIFTFMMGVYEIYQKYPNVDFTGCSNEVPKLSDEEIKQWIRQQKDIEQKKESELLPSLKKNEC